MYLLPRGEENRAGREKNWYLISELSIYEFTYLTEICMYVCNVYSHSITYI